MGFNKRKMEARRAAAAEKEAAARRATEAQVLEDAGRLVTAWNERQAKRMPMLFSPTIGCALKARHWFLWVCSTRRCHYRPPCLFAPQCRADERFQISNHLFARRAYQEHAAFVAWSASMFKIDELLDVSFRENFKTPLKAL
jgi:hypothetical protein